MSRLIDITGQRFGKLTVIKKAEKHPKRTGARWECLCDCGNTTIAYGIQLRANQKHSCGCIIRECAVKRLTTHGKFGTRPYRIWRGIITRCENKNDRAFARYGGRGITICEEWRNDFQSFYDWAMENGYRDDLSIDRIDNNKGYYPDNCRWATKEQQGNNRTVSRYITMNGEKKTLAEWCRMYGIRYGCAAKRLQYGWTPEETFELIPRKKT